MPAKASNAGFARVFAELRDILAAYEPKLKVVHDTPDHYYLDTYTIGPNKHPITFAFLRVMKNYVSYYFMPVHAGHLREMSPALKKRMQGKACFNFTEVDPALFKELKALTKQGYADWKKLKWVD